MAKLNIFMIVIFTLTSIMVTSFIMSSFRLEERGTKHQDIVKYEDVLFQLPKLMESISLVTEFANNKVTVFVYN